MAKAARMSGIKYRELQNGSDTSEVGSSLNSVRTESHYWRVSFIIMLLIIIITDHH